MKYRRFIFDHNLKLLRFKLLEITQWMQWVSRSHELNVTCKTPNLWDAWWMICHYDKFQRTTWMMVKHLWEQTAPSKTHVLFKPTLKRQPRKKTTSKWTNLSFFFLLLLLSIYESNALTEEGRVAWSQSRGVLEKAFRHSWLWWPRRWVRLSMVLSGLITLRAGEWQARCPWADIEVWLD